MFRIHTQSAKYEPVENERVKVTTQRIKRIIRPIVPVGVLDLMTKRRYRQEASRAAVPRPAGASLAPSDAAYADRRHPTAVIFYWSHMFGAVEWPARVLCHALAALQYDVRMVNVEVQAEIDACAQSGTVFDLAFSIGYLPLAKQSDGRPLFEAFGNVFYVWGLDSIINDLVLGWGMQVYFDAARRSTRLRFLFPDRDYAALVGEVLTPAQSCYFPFAGFFDGPPRLDFAAPRQPRLAVLGTIGSELAKVGEGSIADVVAAETAAGLSPPQQARFAEALHAVGGKANVTTLARDVLDLAPDRLLTARYLPLLTKVDAYEKRRRRLLVVGSLRGSPVDFFGLGWDRFLGDCSSFRFFGSIPFAAIGPMFRDYAGVVTFDPNWDHGLHDRVFTALGNGCRVLTNASTALPTLDRPDDGLFSYEVNQPQVGEAVAGMLAAPPLSNAAIMQFRQRNSWLVRMDRFLQAMP